MSRIKTSGTILCLAALLSTHAAFGAETARTYFTGVPTNAAGVWTEATILVEEVNRGGAADQAGVRVGDRIVGLNGRRIRSRPEMELAKKLMVEDGGFHLHVLRDGQVVTLTAPPLQEGRMGVMLSFPNLSADRVAFASFGIKPSEYLGTRQGGRPDGGVLNGLIAAYTPTNPHHCHPVLVQLAAFPPRASERIHLLGQAKRKGGREWVLGLLKSYYALLESRPADARRHLAEAKLLSTPVDPFLNGLAEFYGKLAETPPSSKGAETAVYGVTPEYFTLCIPPPVLPLKIHDWTACFPGLVVPFAQAADGLPWEEEARTAFATRLGGGSDQGDPVGFYLRHMMSALVDCKNHGGWPMRYTPVFEHEGRLALLEGIQSYAATNAQDAVLCALALLVPSALENDTNTYRQAMTTLRDAGSRELGMANAISLGMWKPHGLAARRPIQQIQREVNASLGIPGIYTWLASQSADHEDLLQTGWYVLEYEGLWDGAARMRLAGTVLALGGPVELKPAAK